ncbi:hypothetical protein SAMN05192569_10891, partial [Parageobacillus thermantarcticus]
MAFLCFLFLQNYGSSPKDVLASIIEVWQPFLAELAMQIFGYF